MNVVFTIRPVTIEDAAAVYAAVDGSRPEFAKWMVWYQPTYAPDDAIEWVRRSCAQHEEQTGYHFAIVGADNLIGAISLENVDTQTGTAMLGYWVATPATGRGAATAAVAQILAWASAHTGIQSVYALIAADNVASRRVAEANGMRLAPTASQPANPQHLRYEVALPPRSVT